jgi:O-antigen/teichoic acid export membrane protein
MEIGRKDIFWNYLATFLKIASSALLLPLILRLMPAEMVGIWTVFTTVAALVVLFDFGFNSSFSRNVTYIFSGVKNLKINGIHATDSSDLSVDYSLLKGLIQVMRWFYLRISLILFILLITVGTFYIHQILKSYTGCHRDVYIAWILLCSINTYNLYTLYYDALLQGKGLIKRSKQIIIIGQTVYLLLAAVLIIAGYGLIALVSAQIVSVVIIRILSYKTFFNTKLKATFDSIEQRPQKEILQAIYPNAVKIGFTSLGGFLVNRSAILIGSVYLPLTDLASYGICVQLIMVISALAGIYLSTYQPLISKYRVEMNNVSIKYLYIKGQLLLFFTFLCGGILLVLFGQWGLHLIGSQTKLLPKILLAIMILVTYLEANHSSSASILLTKNEVPFLKASLFSGVATVLLLFVFLVYFKLGLWSLVLAPGIAQGVYQNWKWPLEVGKDLSVHFMDFLSIRFLKLKD